MSRHYNRIFQIDSLERIDEERFEIEDEDDVDGVGDVIAFPNSWVGGEWKENFFPYRVKVRYRATGFREIIENMGKMRMIASSDDIVFRRALNLTGSSGPIPYGSFLISEFFKILEGYQTDLMSSGDVAKRTDLAKVVKDHFRTLGITVYEIEVVPTRPLDVRTYISKEIIAIENELGLGKLGRTVIEQTQLISMLRKKGFKKRIIREIIEAMQSSGVIINR